MVAAIFTVSRGTPEVLPKLAQLVDRVMRPYEVPGEGLRRRFPLVLSDKNADNVYYVDQGHEPVSMAAVWRGQVLVGDLQIPAAAIGLVATLPEHRNGGLASLILERIWRDLKQSHVCIALISGRRDLYFRLGSVVTGNLVRAYGCPQGHADSGLVVEPIVVPRDIRDVVGLYQAEPVRYVRSAGEMARLVQALKYPRRNATHELFVARKDDRVCAYGVLEVSDRGEGVQLTEWAGSRLAVLDLLKWGRHRYRKEQAELMMQANDVAMNTTCVQAGMKLQHSPNSGTMAVLDADGLLSMPGPWSRQRSGEYGPPDGRNNIGGDCTGRCGSLATWIFSPEGLGFPWPYARGLNYV